MIISVMKSFRGLCNYRCIEALFNTETELLIKPYGTASFGIFPLLAKGRQIRANTCTSARCEGQTDHTRHAAPRANVPTVWVQLVWTGTWACAPSSVTGWWIDRIENCPELPDKLKTYSDFIISVHWHCVHEISESWQSTHKYVVK